MSTTIAPSRRPSRTLSALAVVVLLGLGAVACGDDTSDEVGAEPSGEAATSTTTSTDGRTVEVVATDFAFDGLPEEVPVGTQVTLVNDAGRELHELVAFRLPDDETRTAEELMADPSALGGLLAGAEPTMVLLAEAGAPQIAAVGDGTFTEPGRYLVICAIPTGADPAEYLAAAATSDGPPQVEGGAPHFAHGMWGEVEVVA
ncbi:hypothetical protein [Rhabdothermincola salaria]|uniref:hypothetical protein n=1 Tax=Rhabdothermincola salaria TaxID=2903142 RepID=UPI001E56330F|nr:hypothetical protein [Rhabdothermincola salaria]MCD9625704.1 hypothetical protein [Rhabdothermincola salaria]